MMLLGHWNVILVSQPFIFKKTDLRQKTNTFEHKEWEMSKTTRFGVHNDRENEIN